MDIIYNGLKTEKTDLADNIKITWDCGATKLEATLRTDDIDQAYFLNLAIEYLKIRVNSKLRKKPDGKKQELLDSYDLNTFEMSKPINVESKVSEAVDTTKLQEKVNALTLFFLHAKSIDNKELFSAFTRLTTNELDKLTKEVYASKNKAELKEAIKKYTKFELAL